MLPPFSISTKPWQNFSPFTRPFCPIITRVVLPVGNTIGSISLILRISTSASEICFSNFVRAKKLLSRTLKLDPSVLQYVGIIADGKGLLCVLLHQEDCNSRVPDFLYQFIDLVDDDRCQAHGRLVKKENPGRRHKASAYRKHLLLSS